jgi:hypothetical protein
MISDFSDDVNCLFVLLLCYHYLMVSNSENPSSVTSIAENLAKSVPSHLTPLSPEKYIKIEKKEFDLEQLIEMAQEELEVVGITEKEILETIESGKAFITKTEKRLVETEEAVEWATNYWNALNQSFENRLRKGNVRDKVAYADVRLRALGVTQFLDTLSDYTDAETYSQVRDVLTTACDIYIIAEVNTFGLNMDAFDMAKGMGRAVTLGLQDPESIDKAISLVENSNYANLGMENAVRGNIEGIKAECLAGMILTQYEFPDIGYEVTIKKGPALRDAIEGADFILTISEGRHEMELAVFDIKKATTALGEGSCRLVVDSGKVIVYEGDHILPSKRDIYEIEETFEFGLLNHNNIGIVTRLPRNLVEKYTVTELSEMDKVSNSDYNDAKSHIFRELGYVLERIGNQ